MKAIIKQLLLGRSLAFPPPPVFAMTSNTVPSPFVASASSEYDIFYPPFKAFDNVSTGIFNMWASAETPPPHWIAIDLGFIYRVSNYSIRIRSDSLTQSPVNFEFQTSLDNTNWTTVDTRVSQSWSLGETKTYPLNNSQSSRYFRLFITTAESLVATITEFLLS